MDDAKADRGGDCSVKTTFRAKFSADAVDADAGILRGVSVVTMGRVQGLDQTIDRKSLEQFLSCGLSHRHGLKVQTENFSGFDGIVGAMDGFRIDGSHLRGDIRLLASHPARTRIIETASKLPEQVGLAVAFVGTPEIVRGEKLVRCSQLYSVGFSDSPSANPNGLFSHRIESMKQHIHFALPTQPTIPGKVTNVALLTFGGTINGALIDETTLEQFAVAAEQVNQGFTLNIEGVAGFSGAVGKIGNIAKASRKAVGDLFLLRGHPAYEYITEAARFMRDLLAIRVSFTGTAETISGQRFARVASVDPVASLVIADSSNPDGMFSANRTAETRILAEFGSKKGEEATAFYNAHRAEILRAQFNLSLPR